MSELQANLLLDVSGTGPLHGRLAAELRRAIRDGRLPPGSLLPPSRVLAAELGCSRWVVTEAFAQLATAGYTEGRVGSGTRIRAAGAVGADGRAGADGPVGRPAGPGRRTAARVIDMAPGLPDLRSFPLARWAAAIRAAASALSAADLGHPDPAGHHALREVVGEYLARVRGADPRLGSVTICARATDGLTRICLALRASGCQVLAVENPCWHRVREVAASAGLRVVPVSVDEQGIVADRLRDAGAGAVVVTPAHQFPSGVVLSATRRAALLAWARESGGLIIEDDYDAEFRYDRRPVGTMQGTDPAHVVLLGSVSKTLSPAVGIGWLVAPRTWADTVRRLAGLHLVLRLPAGAGAASVRAAALRRGVRVANLDTYRAEPAPDEPGLVLGYGNLPDQDIGPAVRILAGLL